MESAGIRNTSYGVKKRILVDVCLSPVWIPFLISEGFSTVHWTEIGSPSAKDSEIMEYALANDMIVFTNDLDFSNLLAFSNAKGPSVIQIRSQNVLPRAIGAMVILAIKKIENVLKEGAIAVIDEKNLRIRYLPLKMD